MNEKVLDYDVVIIGSGAGGGTVAKELAPLCKSGCRIALLEWGGKFQAKDNLRQEVPMAERYYFDAGGFQTRSQDMTLAFAKAVGGSTTVYTGTSLKAPARVFESWAVPGITAQDLESRYEKYIAENNVHLLPETEINENNRLFVEGCRQLGWHVEQFPVNVKGCHGLGTCNLGCAVLAKQGTAVVQIPAAEKQGVHVVSFCRVDRIEDHDVIAEVTPPQFGLEPSMLEPGRYRFRSKKIVVSAGSVNSPALLLRSFGDRLSPALGRYFTCHPAMILAAAHPHPIENTTGHPKSFYCDQFWESDRFLLETCIYFPFTLAKSLVGFGRQPDELLSHFERLQMILVLAVDRAEKENRVTVDRKGNPVVHYRFSEETVRSFVQAIRASARIFFAAGAEHVHAPSAEKFFLCRSDRDHIDSLVDRKRFKPGQVTISAAHLMGGCRMGNDPAASVTDSWGKVHGRQDLYVADASLFPAASEVNPYLTIMALADRVAEGVRRDMEMH
jgi:choline dehydrogenase-like flavoprotein